MANWSAAETAIAARFEAQWAGPETVALVNRRFERPEPPAPWLLLEIAWNGGEQASIGAPGANYMRRYGMIWLHAFAPRQTAPSVASALLARAATIFEAQDFSGVICDAAEPGGPNDSEDGAWLGRSCSIPFEYEETA